MARDPPAGAGQRGGARATILVRRHRACDAPCASPTINRHAQAVRSSADLAEKEATLEQLADGVFAYTAQGDPNVGCIVGTDAILAIEARATP